jgi:sulfoxide reductase heme-binding subunit YedZ
MTDQSVTTHFWWLASRASGVVALALVSASVMLGLAMAGRIARGPAKRSAMALHEQLSLGGLVAVGVHGLTLIGDSWLRPGLSGILVPFTSSYRPLWTGLGIAAAYLAAALGLSFYARRWLGAPLWRRAHRLTVAVYVLAVAHTLGAGTDAASPWLRWSLLATAVPILFLFLVRVAPGSRARRSPAPRPPARRRHQTPAPAREPALARRPG